MGAKGAKGARETGEGVMRVIHRSRKGVGTQEMRIERRGKGSTDKSEYFGIRNFDMGRKSVFGSGPSQPRRPLILTKTIGSLPLRE